MATTMEQRAKFRELRLAGTPLEEAKATAYGNVAPVSPTISGNEVQPTGGATIPIVPTPTPTPVAPTQPATPTSTVPQDSTLGKAQAIRDANGGTLRDAVSQIEGNTGIMTQAPVNPETGLSAPQVSTPSTPTPTPVKTETPIDYNTSVGREGEIQKNISDITAGNPTLLKDRNAFNKAFGYDTADQGKRAMLDSAFQSGQPRTMTSDEMFSTFLTKTPVSDDQKSSLPYKIAQNRYTKASSYATMTPAQVSGAMNSGKLIEGSQSYEDLKTLNPKIVQDAENLRKANGQSTNIWTYTNNPDGTPVKTNNLEKTFTEDYMDNFGQTLKDMFKVYTTEEIQSIIRTPEVKDAEDKAFEYEKKIDDIDSLIEKSDKQVLESQAGTGATALQIRLLQQSAREKLNEERNGLVKDYTRYANKANNLITQNTTNFQTQQTQMNARNQAMLGFQKSVFDTNLGLQTKKAEADIANQLAREAQNDPYRAIPAMIEEYKKLGIPFTRSTQEIIQDFNTSGQDLSTYLTDLQKTIQSKPEYKAMQAYQMRQYAPPVAEPTKPVVQNFGTSDKPDYRQYNQSTGQWDTVSGLGRISGLPISFTGDTTSYIASKEGFRSEAYQDSGGVWTIGYGTTKINGKPVQPGQTITQEEAQRLLNEDIVKHSNWKNYIDENNLSPSQRTALASFEYNLGPGIWDKGAVNIINMIKSGDLVGAGAEMKKYNTVKGTPIKGLTNRRNEEANLLMNTGVQSTGTQYSESDIELLSELANMDASARNTALKAQGIPLSAVTDYMAAAKSGKIPPTESQKQSATQILSNIQDIASMDWNDATGFHGGVPSIAGTDRATAEAKINNLVASITLPNLGMLKGPMSDKDLAFIQNASAKLALSQSDSEFEKQLIELYNISARKAGLKEITKLSEIPSGRILPGQISRQQTNTGAGQLSPEAQSIEQEWLNRNK